MEAGTETEAEQVSDTDTGSVEERVDRLEAGQQTLSDKLDQLIGMVSRKPPGHADERDGPTGSAGRPASIEEQVQAELARAERERQAAADAQAEKSDREQIKDQLAKLREAPPVQPQRRSERVMWGAR